MGRMEDLRIVDPVLTELSRGYTNNALVREALFPIVEVPKEAGILPQFGREAFKLFDTSRAIGAESNETSPETATTIPFILGEHDLAKPVDYREAEDDQFGDLEQAAALNATAGVQLKMEYLAAVKACDPANYPEGSKLALTSTAKFSSTDDPNVVIRAAKEAIRAKIGKRPNIMVLGPATFNALQSHADLIDKIKYSMKGIITLDLLREIFDIPKIVVGEALYANDAGTTFTDIWGDVAILAYVPDGIGGGRSKAEPSFGYTFRKRGQPIVDFYKSKGGKVTYFRYTTIEAPYIVGAEAGYLLTDCV